MRNRGYQHARWLTCFVFFLSCLALVLSFLQVPHSLVASPSPPELELVVLGSGGPRAFGRAASSYLVLLDGRAKILVDAGSGAFTRLGETHIDINNLDLVLLTHLHIDHSADVPSMFKARGMVRSEPMSFRVFGPLGKGLYPNTTEFIHLLFEQHGIFAYQKTFGAKEEITTTDLPIELTAPQREIFSENGAKITAVATHHGDAPSVAYRIDYKGKSITFSGDLDPTALSNLTRLANSSDLLVFNCAVLDPPGSPTELYTRHTPPKQIGETARNAGVKALLLSHIPPAVEKAESQVMQSVKASYLGSVQLAQDRMRLKF